MKKIIASLLICCISIFMVSCGEQSTIENPNNNSTSISSAPDSVISSAIESSSAISSSADSSSAIISPASAKASSVPFVQIELISIISPINKGAYNMITIQGQPNTSYDINVIYNSGPSTAAGLGAQTSNSSGKVSWTWKVGTRTADGTYPVNISGGGQTFTAHFTVQ